MPQAGFDPPFDQSTNILNENHDNNHTKLPRLDGKNYLCLVICQTRLGLYPSGPRPIKTMQLIYKLRYGYIFRPCEPPFTYPHCSELRCTQSQIWQ